MVHSPSVGPIRMPLWSALEHMLSVMTPVNFCFPGAATNAAIMREPKSSGFMPRLFARRHEVGGRCAGVHDPDTTRRATFGQPESLGGCARNGDGHVRSRVRRIAHRVIPYRSELGLHAGPVFLSGVERGLFLSAHRLELQVLSGPLQVGKAGAFHKICRLPRQS